MTSIRKSKKDTRYYKLSIKTLKEDCYKEARWRGYTILEDYWPYHIIIQWRTTRFSLWCGGLSKNIEPIKLNKKGKPDNRCKERYYATAVAAFNWLDRYFRKKGVKQ